MGGIDLETARLRLRQWRDSDVPALAAIFADPEFARYVGTGVARTAVESQAEFDEYRDEWDRLGHGRWAVEEAATGRLIGYCEILQFREGTPDAVHEVAYGLARDRWGFGLATEAAHAAVAWAFEGLGAESVVGLTHPDNLASQRVLAKLGMKPEGMVQGRHRELLLHRVTRSNFDAIAGQVKPYAGARTPLSDQTVRSSVLP